MAALDYLRQAGLVVELEGKRLRVTPASRITDEHRQYLSDHRADLLAELSCQRSADRASSAAARAATSHPHCCNGLT
ncbi:hypothetical protein FGA82_07405 [Pseudomonas fluorescens]|uniref:hypothetical protein n=1 Tax=Pseudomonas fluorescens TaxID=294 RepID=UPI00113021CB|nr:hypothetical protein [Pseudomonas fluorescens]TMU81375.1 hypothetical protein FGA82_07405 [Pseudomonas fluorescens]